MARLGVFARASAHGVGVDIDGIDGVGHGHSHVGRKDVADVAYVGFGAVANEDFIGVDVDAA